MAATRPHHLAVPEGNRFLTIMKSYLRDHNLEPTINPLFTAHHMNYDHGLFESLNAFLTMVMIIDSNKQPRITEFLSGHIMRDLNNDEYRLSNENHDRQEALTFVKSLL